jgi:uncharacterized protein YggE
MMKNQPLLLLLIYLLTTGLAVGAGEEAVSRPRTVVVSGIGEVSVEPDKAIVSMGAQAIEPELDIAREKVTRTVQSFLRLTRELGIDDKYIQTSQLTVRPEYEWNPKTRQQRLMGYFVERQLTVDLRNLEQLGVLMERAVSTGVNLVSGPEFGSSREDELRRKALARAAVDARASAEALAQSLSAELGPLRRITATGTGLQPPPMPYAMAKAELADAGAAETYQTGQIKITAQVTAEFDLAAEQ